jgi:uncharacterized protein with NRDE domain
MCLTFFTILPEDSQNLYRFVMAFNRVEKSVRKTLPFGAFKEDPNILAGRDVISGGSWLGINVKVGVIVILTNYNEEIRCPRRSRGKLVYSFLSTSSYPKGISIDETIERHMAETIKIQGEYCGFNLTVYSIHSNRTYYINNKQELRVPRILEKGHNYALGNIDIDTVQEKSQYGLGLYSKVIEELNFLSCKQLSIELETIMNDTKSFSENPNDEASIFVQPYYCTLDNAQRRTKSTTFIFVKHDLTLEVREVTHSDDKVSTVSYSGSF